MESFTMRKTASGLEVDGLPPDATKLVKLNGKLAKRVADLALHRSDLEFAKQCLLELNKQPSNADFLKIALWRCAVVHFGKCFGNSASRGQLSYAAIYKGDKEGLDVFNYFISLRDKNIVHDENPYSQSLPCAAINDGTKAFKVEKIVTLSFLVNVLDQDNFTNLMLLIDKALAWVVAPYESACNELSVKLETETYKTLAAREPVTYSKPNAEQIHDRRQT